METMKVITITDKTGKLHFFEGDEFVLHRVMGIEGTCSVYDSNKNLTVGEFPDYASATIAFNERKATTKIDGYTPDNTNISCPVHGEQPYIKFINASEGTTKKFCFDCVTVAVERGGAYCEHGEVETEE